MKRLLIFSILTLNLLVLQNALAASKDIQPKKSVITSKLNFSTSDSSTIDTYGNVRVFGFSQKEVLTMDGDPNGTACSDRHTHDDLSNRWCHAFFVKLIDGQLRSKGVPMGLSSFISALAFVPKEFFIDKKPSMADLMIAEYPFHEFENNSGKIAVTLFADRTAILTVLKTF